MTTMVIRRLQLDDEYDAVLPPQSNHVEPLEISSSSDDDDGDNVINVSDNSPLPQNQSPISDSLRRLGLSLKSEWLRACVGELERSVVGFSGFDVSAKAKLCFQQFLFSDMNYCGNGVLPPNVDSFHLVHLPGPFVLQVDEIINISCPLRGRYQHAPPGLKRCLKLSMTDGIQRVFGMEYRPIQALEVCAPAGLKVAICNVHIRHGLLMLVPETIEILGGLVEELDAARKRLVDELNKPPRGKRTKNGVLPPLAARATLVAWPARGADDTTQTNCTVLTASIQTNNQHASLRVSSAANNSTAEDTPASSAQNAPSYLVPDMVSVESMHVDTHADSMQLSSTTAMARAMNINTANRTRENATRNLSYHAVPNVVEEHNDDTIQVRRQDSVATMCSPIAQNVEERNRDRIPIITENSLDGASSLVSNIDDTHTAEANDVNMVDTADHPLMLSGDQEIPFTYLASLSAKWATMKESSPFVQGKVKCFLTGVKGFQYKQRETYDLQVYIDDGSLISEVLIDHNIVQKGIGYSPEEVTAALSSKDKKIVQEMKGTMRKFQYYLANFEGIMLVEFNAKSSVPMVIEMSEGCPPCDAWLLLRRLRSLFPAHDQRDFSPDPIELSP